MVGKAKGKRQKAKGRGQRIFSPNPQPPTPNPWPSAPSPQPLVPNLAVEIAGIRMKNPVMTASGTFGYAEEFAPYFDLSRLGAIVVKTITLWPRPGAPPPRIAETPAGMLNAIGLQNVGIDAFIEQKLPYLRRLGPPILVNIAGESIQEYAELAKRLSDQEGIRGLELNISCPNVENGMEFAQDPQLTSRLVGEVRKATPLPVIPKLSPNVTDIKVIALAAAEAGADALSLINTLVGMAIDVKRSRPKIAHITGGLSGPAIRPIAVWMVWEVSQVVKLPLIGMGGILTAEDALEFLIAGATAVAVGTASFVDPLAPLKVIEGIERSLSSMGIQSITELIGSLHIGDG